MKIIDTDNPIKLNDAYYQASKIFCNFNAGGVIVILNKIIIIPYFKIALQLRTKRYFYRPLAENMSDSINNNIISKSGDFVGIWWETSYEIKDLQSSMIHLQKSKNVKNTSELFNYLTKNLTKNSYVKSI